MVYIWLHDTTTLCIMELVNTTMLFVLGLFRGRGNI